MIQLVRDVVVQCCQQRTHQVRIMGTFTFQTRNFRETISLKPNIPCLCWKQVTKFKLLKLKCPLWSPVKVLHQPVTHPVQRSNEILFKMVFFNVNLTALLRRRDRTYCDPVHSPHGRGWPAERPHRHHLHGSAALLRFPALPQELLRGRLLFDAGASDEGRQEEGGETGSRSQCTSDERTALEFTTRTAVDSLSHSHTKRTNLHLVFMIISPISRLWPPVWNESVFSPPQNDCDCASDCSCSCSICTRYKEESQNHSQHLDRVLDGKKNPSETLQTSSRVYLEIKSKEDAMIELENLKNGR